MTTIPEDSIHPEPPQERPASSPAPDGHRVLHVVVPDRVFNHVKAQAALSGMPFRTYMEHFLMEASPYNAPDPPAPRPAGTPSQQLAGIPSPPTNLQ